MTFDSKDKRGFRIPIRFSDAENESESPSSTPTEMDRLDPDFNPDTDTESEDVSTFVDEVTADEALGLDDITVEHVGGPEKAGLIATRADLLRVDTENAELKKCLPRRHADFENYRKRMNSQRNDLYNRVMDDIC